MIDISIALSDDRKTGTIVIAGVPVTGAAVSPPPPPPVEEPPPVEITYKLSLSIDKDPTILKVGDTFTLTAVMQGSDGSTKPVNAYRIYGFDSTIVNKIAPVSDWQRTFAALAPGTTTIKDDFASQTAKLAVTVAAVDSVPVTDPPPVDKPPPVSPPPPPPPPTAATSSEVPNVVADGQSILYHYPTDIAFNDAVDWIDIPGEFGGSPARVQKVAWNFGDGTNGYGADGRHPYDTPGTYTITGSVSMKDGTITPFGPLTVQVGT